MPALFALLGPACGREAGNAGKPSAASEVLPPSGSEKSAAFEADARARLEAVVRADLERELRPRVLAELRTELEPEVRQALMRELGGASPPGPIPTTTSGTATAPLATVAIAASDRPDASSGGPDTGGASGAVTPDSAESPKPDIWSTPGTKIWPSPGGFRLVEVAVGTALEEKLPVNVQKRYSEVPELLYCYTLFENPGAETTVTHVWRRGSRLVSRVELEVGASPRWKTWSKQRTQKHWTGLWSCEVLGPEGQQLGLTVFALGGG